MGGGHTPSYNKQKKKIMLNELIKKRDSILDVFKQAKSDLEGLNVEIDNEISKNEETLRAIQEEQKGLNNLRQSSNSSIKNLSKILGNV